MTTLHLIAIFVYFTLLQVKPVHCTPGFTEYIIQASKRHINRLVYPVDLGTFITEILDTHMGGCHTVVATVDGPSNTFSSILRALDATYNPYTTIELGDPFLIHNESTLQILKRGYERGTCRVLVFDLLSSQDLALAVQFMESINLPLIPDVFIIFLGPNPLIRDTLENDILQNTIHVLYMVVDPYKGSSYPVAIYSRCLFCNNGQPGIDLINIYTSDSGFMFKLPLIREQFHDMQGYKMRIVQLNWYPMVGYIWNSKETSAPVTPIDSLHVRALNAVATSLNFTYEMRLPWDCQWGISTQSGNWTGIIGTLQHHKADFSMAISYVLGRMKVVRYTRIVIKEPVKMVMSKPRPPPQYLSIIHPLTGDLWAIIIASGFLAALVLWILQRGWKQLSGLPGFSVDLSFLYTWSILFEEPASKLPSNTSSLIFLAFWWIYCTLITVAYKSSLIAHLSVPGKSKSINTLEEMLEGDGWTWGYNDNHSGTYQILRRSENHVMQRVFQGLQIQPNEEQAERVLEEQHVLLVKEYLFQSLKTTIAKNRGGVTPYYYGRSEYFANGDGWAFRQNAPFYNAIDMKIQQLIETGHISHWLKDLVGTSLEDPCEGSSCDEEINEELHRDEHSDHVVLGVSHLQSAFYLLLMGMSFSSLVFAAENIYKMI